MTEIEKPLNELRKKEEKVANQVIGNIGLYYTCLKVERPHKTQREMKI
jgi:hypothetical protein